MRPSGMRNRLMVSVAVLAFGMAGLGLALVAARSGDSGSLPKLPFAAAGAGGRAEAADAAAMMAPAGRIEYRVEGELPALPMEAAAYRLSGDDGAAAARRLAAALGIDGEVEKRDGSWRVRDDDRELFVHDQPGLPWNLGVACPSPKCPEDGGGGVSGSSGSASGVVTAEEAARETAEPAPEPGPTEPAPPDGAEPGSPPPDDAEPGPPPADDSGATVTCIRPAPPDCPDTADCPATDSRCATTPVPEPQRPAHLPDKDAAERQARELFDRLGVAFDRLDVSDGITAWWVNARTTVGGVPTFGLDASVSIGSKGVVETGYGHAGRPDRIGDYPLVGTEKGLQRLREGVGIGPRPMADTAIGAPEIAVCDEAHPCPEPEPQVVTITGAHLALQLVGDTLVPVYVFEVEDGGGEGPMVPAVVDELLKEMDEDTGPVDEPEAPVKGGHGCSMTAALVGDADAEGEPADKPLTVEVCGPSTAKVGEEVTIDVTVTDPDATIIEEGCGAPAVAWGDEDGAVMAGCMPACAAPLRESSGPGKFHRTFRHTYSKPGEYTVRFTFQSEFCTTGSSSGEGEHVLRVTE